MFLGCELLSCFPSWAALRLHWRVDPSGVDPCNRGSAWRPCVREPVGRWTGPSRSRCLSCHCVLEGLSSVVSPCRRQSPGLLGYRGFCDHVPNHHRVGHLVGDAHHSHAPLVNDGEGFVGVCQSHVPVQGGCSLLGDALYQAS